MEHFRESCSFKRIMKGPTCFKKSGKSFCINLILINSPYNFQNCCAIEKGLSNFHKMIDSVMKTTFQKLQPKIVQYRLTLNFVMMILGKNFSKNYH